MATVVYQGLTGGDLFAGTKFYLLQRIPSRNTWKDLITANGGEIVQIEKQADMIIADHIRKDAPPGSISWTYIDQSVKKGSLQDIEEHRAGPPTHIVRDVDSGQATRKGKVPFTEEDDRFLMEQCTRAERQGVSTRGNELYKQLEHKNSRHTWQSWRDRWIKYVSHRPRPEPSEDEEDEGEGNAPHPIRSSPKVKPPTNKQFVPQSTVRLAPKPSPRSLKILSRPARRVSEEEFASSSRKVAYHTVSKLSSPTHPYMIKSSGGSVFTDEETKLLESEYDAIMNLDDDQVIDAWIAWATAHPSHTPQEWRNYFKEYVAPKKEAGAEEVRKRSGGIVPSATQKSRGSDASRSSASIQANHQVIEIKDSQDSSGQNLSSQETQRASVDPALLDERLFKADLTTLADSLDLDVEFNPVICGKPISLFKLWQVVKSPEFGGFDIVDAMQLWPKVANKLNFNNFRHLSAADDLRGCYSEILADFETARAEYEEEPLLTDSQEKKFIESQLLESTEHESLKGSEESQEVGEEQDDNLTYPRLSPARLSLLSSSKRNFETDQPKKFIHSKRQRVEKGNGKDIEIPPTPEDIINSNQMCRPSYQPSPLKFSTSHKSDSDLSESENISIKPINFNPSRPSRARVIKAEPETQDFRFQPEPDLEEQDDSGSYLQRSSPPVLGRKMNNGSSSIARDSFRSSNSYDDSSSQLQSDSQRDTTIQEYVNGQVALGIPAEIVFQALDHTTFEYGPVVGIVMESLLQDEGIPQDTPGAWTAWDDSALSKPTHSKEFQNVMKKHGAKRIRTRRRFLQELREIQKEAG